MDAQTGDSVPFPPPEELKRMWITGLVKGHMFGGAVSSLGLQGGLPAFVDQWVLDTFIGLPSMSSEKGKAPYFYVLVVGSQRFSA